MLCSAVALLTSAQLIDGLTAQNIVLRVVWPILRLMLIIAAGLVAAQFIEASGWTRSLALLARPLFRFAKLGDRCSTAFTTAFFSGTAANAMLHEYYQEGLITRQQLFLTNFVNQLPMFFLHLPTTFFIIVPLTGTAGLIYLALTLLAAIVRTLALAGYGHLLLLTEVPTEPVPDNPAQQAAKRRAKSRGSIWQSIRSRLPGRLMGIAVYVIPCYILVFLLNAMGLFGAAREWMARFVVTQFLPMEALSIIVLSFAAEFSSGFAAAGALQQAGVLNTSQTVLALLIGNIIAFPVRAVRHQLPRYVGIFAPAMGTQLLLMGQLLRIASLILVGAVYLWLV